MKNKGITLVALVITIIILLILAGITMNALAENGLFEKTKLAKEEYRDAEKLENGTLGEYESEIGKYIDGTREQKVETCTAYTAENTNVVNTISLGSYKITDYDYMLLTGKTPSGATVSQIYKIQYLEIGKSNVAIIGLNTGTFYTVTDEKTLTLNAGWGNNEYYISNIDLIKLK